MNCPNCTTAMDHVALGGRYGPDVDIDICFACHVMWLDKRESLQLSPKGTLHLFELLHEHSDDARHSLGDGSGCPRCGQLLQLMNDIGKGGRFSYYKCPAGDGRLTPFSEFLKEKQFVRSLSPVEQERIKAEIKQLQCSGCGAPIDVQKGFVCGHCGSPVTVLDRDAVAKTLQELNEAQAAREAVDPDDAEKRARALAAMETMRTDPNEQWDRWGRRRSHRGLGTDLLSASIDFIFGL